MVEKQNNSLLKSWQSMMKGRMSLSQSTRVVVPTSLVDQRGGASLRTIKGPLNQRLIDKLMEQVASRNCVSLRNSFNKSSLKSRQSSTVKPQSGVISSLQYMSSASLQSNSPENEEMMRIKSFQRGIEETNRRSLEYELKDKMERAM